MLAALFIEDSEWIDDPSELYDSARLEMIGERVELLPDIITSQNIEHFLSKLVDCEIIFSTWNMPVLTEEQIDQLKNLKVIFYAAGTVEYFAKPYLERGIVVCNAAAANAVPVAQFTCSQIQLSLKNYFLATRTLQVAENWSRLREKIPLPGAYGETVALIGCGLIAKLVAKELLAMGLRVLVVDPYLPEEEAFDLGVELCSVEKAFSESFVVSNHLPDIEETKAYFKKEHFALMREGATFINTGRGAQLDELELCEVLNERKDLTALLDVSYPEPPNKNSLLYSMDNIYLSPHIAGSFGNEVGRMADYVLEEFSRWLKSEPLLYSVTKEMLERMGKLS